MKNIKNLLIRLFVPIIFWQLKNKKFMVIERAFVTNSICFLIGMYGAIFHYNTVQIIPFLIPIGIAVYGTVFLKVDVIEDLSKYWQTQLKYLKDSRFKNGERTAYEKMLTKSLEEDFENTYGVKYDNIDYAKLNKWQPLALGIAGALLLWFFA